MPIKNLKKKLDDREEAKAWVPTVTKTLADKIEKKQWWEALEVRISSKARLLDTMSFVDALPSFKIKQWQVIILLFIEALSVHRLPSLAPQMTSTNMLLHKARLLDTMSFADALPSFKMRQWQVIILLFIEALSVHRLPSLAPQMASMNMLLHKVLNAAQVSSEEYETIRDLVMPLGRVPQFLIQNGALE